MAQVRARAAGILQKILFREGSDVKAGQALFQIDPAPYRAAHDSAKATLARAAGQPDPGDGAGRALQAAARGQRHQQAGLRQRRPSRRSSPRPTSRPARRAVQTAQDQPRPGHRSTSPIAGRIGRALVTEGALVGQGEATPLAVVQQINPMYVNFTQSASDVLRLRQALASGRLQRAPGGEAVVVRVVLDDGSRLPAGRASCCSRTSRSTRARARSRCAPRCRTRRARCCPACTCGCGSSRRRRRTPSCCRSRRCARSNEGDSVKVVGADGKVVDARR